MRVPVVLSLLYASATIGGCGNPKKLVIGVAPPQQKTPSGENPSTPLSLVAEARSGASGRATLGLVARGGRLGAPKKFSCVTGCPVGIAIESRSGVVSWPVAGPRAFSPVFAVTDGDRSARLQLDLAIEFVPQSPCTAEGQRDCLAGVSFRAALVEGLARKVVAGEMVAGVKGEVAFPPAASVLAGALYGAGGAGKGTLPECSAFAREGCYAGVGWTAVESASLIPGVVKKGVSLGGVLGGYPSASHPLPGAGLMTDLPSLASSVSAGTYEFWNAAGERSEGAIAEAGIITPGTTDQSFSAPLYKGFSVRGNAGLLASNIKKDVVLFGVTGQVVPRPLDCAVEGAADCVATGNFVAGPVLGNVITEDFDDGSVNPMQWTVSVPANTIFSGGALTFDHTGSPWHELMAMQEIDYRGLSISARVAPVVADPGRETYVAFTFRAEDGSVVGHASVLFGTSSLIFRTSNADGTVPSGPSETYDPVAHARWRIRHDRVSDRLHWETATASGPWSIRHSEPFPFPTARTAKAWIGSGVYSGAAIQQGFDDLILRRHGGAP